MMHADGNLWYNSRSRSSRHGRMVERLTLQYQENQPVKKMQYLLNQPCKKLRSLFTSIA